MTPLVTGIVLSRTFPFVYFLTVEKSLFRGGTAVWPHYGCATDLHQSFTDLVCRIRSEKHTVFHAL